MRAILIDPYTREIKEVDVPYDSKKGLEPLYDIMGHAIDTIERVQFKFHDPMNKELKSQELWLDENGFAKQQADFMWRNCGIYMGPGLLCNNNIRSLSDKITVDIVKQYVRF